MLTMLLGGLWHGASWTFVVWGGLHGSYLLINHAYRTARLRFSPPTRLTATLGRVAAAALTFAAVVVAWVFFRATTFDGATAMLRAMTRFAWPAQCAPNCFAQVYGGLSVPPTSLGYLGAFFLAGYVIVWLLPTSQAFARRFERSGGSVAWFSSGALLFFVALLALINASHRSSEFIYFNF
jgi:hypothetical protein